VLTPQEIKSLSSLNPVRAYLSIAGDYALLALLWTIGILSPHPVVILLLMPLVARTQLALAILMHDGAHRRLHPNPKTSDFISQFFLAGPIFFSAESYKKNHLLHHKIPLTEDDPDLSLIAGYPVSRTSFFRKILRDLSGISYFKFIRYFLYGRHQRAKKLGENAQKKGANLKEKKLPLWKLIVSIVVPNLLFFSVFFLASKPWLYFFLWVLPTWTFLQLFLRLRGIAEHSGREANNDQAQCSRTVVNPWQAFFIAPHNVNYHIEHHLYVGIPYYNLPMAHKIMRERGALPQHNVYDSYIPVIKELVKT
jgi:fatty acid desaturase